MTTEIITSHVDFLLNGKAQDFIDFIIKSTKGLYSELKNHDNFKEFLIPSKAEGVFCLTGKYKDMPYIISITGEITSLYNMVRIEASAGIGEKNENDEMNIVDDSGKPHAFISVNDLEKIESVLKELIKYQDYFMYSLIKAIEKISELNKKPVNDVVGDIS